MSSAEEALGAYILTFFDEDLKLPSASDIRSIPDPEDGFVSLVSASIDPYKDTKAVKKTLTIPSWLNERATKLNINFSQTLQDALLKKIYSA